MSRKMISKVIGGGVVVVVVFGMMGRYVRLFCDVGSLYWM